MIRVLLVDDHTVVRECLAAALGSSSDVRVVGEAGDGVTAIELATTLRPDVAIIDITMPGLSGIEVARRLHADLPQTRVLVLTMHEDEEYVLHMVRSGASGYLLKHAATAELLDAVRTLAGGGVHFGAYAAKVLATEVHHPHKASQDPYGALSPREREVLHLVVEGLTSKEVAKRMQITEKSAENYRSRILAKLDCRNSVELVRYAIQKRIVQ